MSSASSSYGGQESHSGDGGSGKEKDFLKLQEASAPAELSQRPQRVALADGYSGTTVRQILQLHRENTAYLKQRAEKAEEKNGRLRLQVQEQKEYIEAVKERNEQLQSTVQDVSQRYRNLKEETKRKTERDEKILSAAKRCKEDFQAAKVARTLADSTKIRCG